MESSLHVAEVGVAPERHARIVAHQLDSVAQPTEVNEGLADGNTQVHGTAPIDTLPNELLIAIMKLVCLHDFPRCRHNTRRPLDAALTISHTSRRWRTIALGEPSIWACVHVGPTRVEGVHKRLELQLERAGDALLSVVFMRHVGEHGYYLRSWLRLCEHSAFWRRCSISVDGDNCMGGLLDVMSKGHYPNLETLCLVSVSPATVVLQGIALPAPVLRRLHIQRVSIYRLQADLFKQLTELKMTDVVGIHLHLLLSFLAEQTPNLKSLVLAKNTLAILNPNVELPDDSSLPKLEHLALASMQLRQTFAGLVRKLYASCTESLKTLHLGVDYPTDAAITALRPSTLELSAVRTFELVNYQPTTQSLRNTLSFARDPRAMRRIVDALPSVEIFEAHLPATQFLATLIECDESGDSVSVAWPSLHTLRISEVDRDALISFLEHRIELGRPIRTLSLHPNLRQKLSSMDLERFAAFGANTESSYYPHFVDDRSRSTIQVS